LLALNTMRKSASNISPLTIRSSATCTQMQSTASAGLMMRIRSPIDSALAQRVTLTSVDDICDISFDLFGFGIIDGQAT